VLEGNAHDDLAFKLGKIYELGKPTAVDAVSLNRHAIRLLRYCKGLSSHAVSDLHQAMIGYLSLKERLKYGLYRVLNYLQ
jgi:hypothetical protein